MAQAIDDVLVDNLQYKLGEGASYVDGRESCTFFPLGSNIYSPSSGNKVLRIALNADGGFLDPSTVRFNFTVRNNGAVIGSGSQVVPDYTKTAYDLSQDLGVFGDVCVFYATRQL